MIIEYKTLWSLRAFFFSTYKIENGQMKNKVGEYKLGKGSFIAYITKHRFVDGINLNPETHT